MGANIGTTITAWLIAILGFKVSMSAIALPLVGLGFLLTFSKKVKLRHWHPKCFSEIEFSLHPGLLMHLT